MRFDLRDLAKGLSGAMCVPVAIAPFVMLVRAGAKGEKGEKGDTGACSRSHICTSPPKRHTDTAQAPHASHGGLWRTTRGGSECAEALPCFGGISRPRGIALCVSGL